MQHRSGGLAYSICEYVGLWHIWGHAWAIIVEIVLVCVRTFVAAEWRNATVEFAMGIRAKCVDESKFVRHRNMRVLCSGGVCVCVRPVSDITRNCILSVRVWIYAYWHRWTKAHNCRSLVAWRARASFSLPVGKVEQGCTKQQQLTHTHTSCCTSLRVLEHVVVESPIVWVRYH